MGIDCRRTFLSLHNFCSMLSKELTDLRKVRTENLKFRIDLRDGVMGNQIKSISNLNTVDNEQFVKNRYIEKWSSSNQCRSLRGFQTSHFI